MSKAKGRKLIDEIHDVMRLHYHSIHTEQIYCDWIKKRFVQFHKMTAREDLKNGESKRVPQGSSLFTLRLSADLWKDVTSFVGLLISLVAYFPHNENFVHIWALKDSGARSQKKI